MTNLKCPYCDCKAEESTLYTWHEGGKVIPNDVDSGDEEYFVMTFECKECDREFHVNENVYLHYYREQADGNTLPSDCRVLGLGKSDIVKKAAEAAGIPIVLMFKYTKYFIDVDDESTSHFIQDMVFEFGYKWEFNGQKYLEKSFNYLCIEPETKRLTFLLDKPIHTKHIIDLHGLVQLLNGTEPSKKPDEIDHFSEKCQHSEYPREEWRLEVTERNTQLGYWEWVDHRIEADDE